MFTERIRSSGAGTAVLRQRAPVPLSWIVALHRRVRMLWFWKMCGTAIGITGFLWAYFLVMRHTPIPVTLVPLTPWDGWIDVSDAALGLYASLWLYVALAPAFARGARDLLAYTAASAAMGGLGLLFFWFCPTAVPDFGVDWAHYPALQFLKAADGGGNAFPSLHVAFAVFTAGVLRRQLRTVRAPAWARAFNVAWAVAICYATLATRQHGIVDAVGGSVLGWLALAGLHSRGWSGRFPLLRSPA
jgi:membrane-associated phospholipid phosphatase